MVAAPIMLYSTLSLDDMHTDTISKYHSICRGIGAITPVGLSYSEYQCKDILHVQYVLFYARTVNL